MEFIKKNWFKIIIILIIFLVGLSLVFISYFLQKGAQSVQPQPQFNPELVQAKQDCQNKFTSWDRQITVTDAGGKTWGIGAHFNSVLNTCLGEYTWTRSADGTQAYFVVDIYERKQPLLELDLEMGGVSSVGIGVHLLENGRELNTRNPSDEYDKRKNVLFSE